MSRRFNSRHGHVTADPNAKPAPAVELTDDNSVVDPLQPDRRIPLKFNSRKFRVATSTVDAERVAAIASARAKASKKLNDQGDDSGA